MKPSIATLCFALTVAGVYWAASTAMESVSDDINRSPHAKTPAVGFLEREAEIRSQRSAMAVLCPQVAAFDMSHGSRIEDGPTRIWVNGSVP